MKERLDVLLVKRGLAASREKAKAVIMAGGKGTRISSVAIKFLHSVRVSEFF